MDVDYINNYHTDRQLSQWTQKQKGLVKHARTPEERDYILLMWQGFLSGLRLTNAINYQQYLTHYRELKDFCREVAA